MEEKVFLDDIEVGFKYYASDKYEMKKDLMIEFAKKYDPQHFHINEETAEDSFFNGLAASGWFTNMVMFRRAITDHPFGFDFVGADAQVEWPAIVRPGDVLTFDYEVTEIVMSDKRPGQGRFKVLSSAYNQDGEVVCQMTATVLGQTRAYFESQQEK